MPRESGWRTIYARLNRSEEHTSELQSLTNLVCRLLLEKICKARCARFTMRASRMISTQIRQVLAFFSNSVVAALRVKNSALFLWRLSTVSLFFNYTSTSEIYSLSLHDSLPI